MLMMLCNLFSSSSPPALLHVQFSHHLLATLGEVINKFVTYAVSMSFFSVLSISFFAQIVSLDLIHVETKTAQQIYELVSEEMRK